MGQQLPVAADRRLPSAQRGKPLTQALVKDTRALKPVWQRGAEHRQFHVTARVMWLSVPVRSRARLQVTPAATRPSPVLLPPRGCPGLWAGPGLPALPALGTRRASSSCLKLRMSQERALPASANTASGNCHKSSGQDVGSLLLLEPRSVPMACDTRSHPPAVSCLPVRPR